MVDGGIVLLRRSIEPAVGKWVFPGGFVDRGETVAAAAVRETLEEVNLKVSLTGILDVYSFPGSQVVVVVYAAEVVGGELIACDECERGAGVPARGAFPGTSSPSRARAPRCATTSGGSSRACGCRDDPSDDRGARSPARARWPAPAATRRRAALLDGDPRRGPAAPRRAPAQGLAARRGPRVGGGARPDPRRRPPLWPRSAEAHNALARCLHALGRDDEALERGRGGAGAARRRRQLRADGARSISPSSGACASCAGSGRPSPLAEEGLQRMPDAVLAQWATQVEDELVEAEKERC